MFQETNVTYEKSFKTINIDNIDILLEKTRKLDYYQKKVVEIGIHYARDVVKATKSGKTIPYVPLYAVKNCLTPWPHLLAISVSQNCL